MTEQGRESREARQSCKHGPLPCPICTPEAAEQALPRETCEGCRNADCPDRKRFVIATLDAEGKTIGLYALTSHDEEEAFRWFDGYPRFGGSLEVRSVGPRR